MNDYLEKTQPTHIGVEMISPPNKLKDAVGHGGLDQQNIRNAQRAMEVSANATDFRVIAHPLVRELQEAFKASLMGDLQGSAALESIMYPAMQLKAQGGMFKYSLMTEICNTLVNFLETLDSLDHHASKIIDAYIKTISVIIRNSMTGDGGQKGKELRDALTDVCNRYYRTKLG